ncbi:MAG: lytic murein transglycosylase [SAR324 cluster bacterium]|nr:lytic murein transglycosylase [SAR324 cluster bacterium]
MDFRWRYTRCLPLCLLLLLATVSLSLAHPPQRKPFSERELQPLLEALEHDGLPREYLEQVLFDPRLRRLNKVIGLNAMNAEFTRDYSDFLAPYALRKARRFSRRYRTLLRNVEHVHGVPKNVLVALLLVETQFGKAKLRYRVLEVYTSLVVDSAPEAVDRYYERLKPKYPQLERDFLERRMEEKGEWAFRELSALLTIGREQGWDLYTLMGSYAGAFGIPQFLPSSYQLWAVDGNKDSKINLDDIADALHSVATYLKEHGWIEGAEPEQRREAVWEYNHSSDYVDAIFAIYRALDRGAHKRKPAAAKKRSAPPKPAAQTDPARPTPKMDSKAGEHSG